MPSSSASWKMDSGGRALIALSTENWVMRRPLSARLLLNSRVTSRENTRECRAAHCRPTCSGSGVGRWRLMRKLRIKCVCIIWPHWPVLANQPFSLMAAALAK